MTAVRCVRAEFLIERRATGLSAAEALRLEAHLAHCEHCSEQARMLSGLRRLSVQADEELSPIARERALTAAFAEAAALERSPHAARGLGSRPALFAIGFACAAALALGLVLSLRATPNAGASARAARPEKTAAVAAGDRVLAGVLERDGRPLDSHATLEGPGSLSAPRGATLALAHATIELAPGSAIRWNAAVRVLALDAGQLSAEVDPNIHRSFAVQTPGFTVRVLGTHFDVTLEGVSVARGRVQVEAPDGRVLASALGPGERFELARATAETQKAPEPTAVAHAAPGDPVRPRRAEHAPSNPQARASTAAPASVDVGALLGQARAELAARHVVDSRQKIDAALAASPPRSLRAEALSLRAECALVGGDLGAAVEAYLRVARAFEDLPAGENALFAAARLETERGQSAAAARELERYLARYPQGRFVKEAKARLLALDAVLERNP